MFFSPPPSPIRSCGPCRKISGATSDLDFKYTRRSTLLIHSCEDFIESLRIRIQDPTMLQASLCFLIDNVNGWCELHNTGCIKQVAGYVIWARIVLLYKGAVTHKGLLYQGDCKANATPWHETTNVPLKKHSTG